MDCGMRGERSGVVGSEKERREEREVKRGKRGKRGKRERKRNFCGGRGTLFIQRALLAKVDLLFTGCLFVLVLTEQHLPTLPRQ